MFLEALCKSWALGMEGWREIRQCAAEGGGFRSAEAEKEKCRKTPETKLGSGPH